MKTTKDISRQSGIGSSSLHHRLMLGASVAVLLLATPAMAQTTTTNLDGCARTGSVVDCRFGLYSRGTGPFGVHADETIDGFATTAVNATDLDGVSGDFRPLIEVRQSGDIAITTAVGVNINRLLVDAAGASGNLTADLIRQVVSDAGVDIPDTEIARVVSAVDANGDGVVSVDALFSFLQIETVTEEIVGFAGAGSTVTLDQIRQIVTDEVPAGTDVAAFLSGLPVNADGTVNADIAAQRASAFITDNFNLDVAVEGSLTRLINNGPGPVISAQSAAGTVNINNGVDLTAAAGSGVLASSGGYTDPATGALTTGGNVTLTNSGALTVAGAGSIGVGARSLGGDVIINNSGAISAIGNSASGIRGEGAQGSAVAISNSGAITSSGDAIRANTDGWGTVTVTNAGAINAEGSGIDAANNGAGSVSVTNSGNLTTARDAIRASSSGGGNVSLTNSGTINVSGDNGYGLSAFTGLDNSGATPGSGNVDLVNSGTVRVAGNGSVGIEGGSADVGDATVNITTDADVIASGADSYGILAHSDGSAVNITVGQGATVQGGTGGTAFSLDSQLTQTPVDFNGDGVPDGVNYDSNGRLHGAAGIVFIGGGENILNNAGTITALNGQAISTFAGDVVLQNYDFTNYNGASGQAPPVVSNTLTFAAANETINNAATGVINGDINLGDGNNALNNAAGGTVTGNFTTGSGNDRFANAGVFTGNVDLGAGSNTLSIASGGVMNIGTTLNVGAGNTIANAGTLSPGGAGHIETTTITGNLVQSGTGNLQIDINDQADGQKNDLINVTGTATLAGHVTPHVTNLSVELDGEFTILVAEGGLTNDGLSTGRAEQAAAAGISVGDLAGISFGLDFRGDNTLVLTSTSQSIGDTLGFSDTAPATTTSEKNIAALGEVFDSAAQQGQLDGDLLVVANALRTQTTKTEARKAAARLVPQNQGQQGANAAVGIGSFGNAMLSCKVQSGQYSYTREGQCYWGKLTGRKLNRTANVAHAGVNEQGVEFLGGVQFKLWDDLRLGVALGYESSFSKSFDTAQSLGKTQGDRFQGGLVLKNQWGPVNAYLNLAGSYGSYDSTRYVNLGGFTNAYGNQKIATGMSRLRLSYLMDGGAYYMKPIVDFSATYLHMGGYAENGAGAFNLRIGDTNEWLLSVSPSVEFGGETKFSDGSMLRPYVRVGATFVDKNSLSTSVGFAAAAPGVAPFKVVSGLDKITADVDAGLYLLGNSGYYTQINYEGHYTADTKQHAVSLKMGIGF